MVLAHRLSLLSCDQIPTKKLMTLRCTYVVNHNWRLDDIDISFSDAVHFYKSNIIYTKIGSVCIII